MTYPLKLGRSIYYHQVEEEIFNYQECKSEKKRSIKMYKDKTYDLKCENNNKLSNSIRCKFTEYSRPPVKKCLTKIPKQRKKENNFIIKLSNNEKTKIVYLDNFTMEYTYNFIPSIR